MRKRTIDVLEDCLAVLESTQIEDTDALIGQLKAEIALYRARTAVREAFEKRGRAREQVQARKERTPAHERQNPYNRASRSAERGLSADLHGRCVSSVI